MGLWEVERWVSALAHTGAQAAALLAVVALAGIALRNRSAAARHRLWFFGMVGVLLLPLASVVIPAQADLPRWVAEPAAPFFMGRQGDAPSAARSETRDVPPPARELEVESHPAGGENEPEIAPVRGEPSPEGTKLVESGAPLAPAERSGSDGALAALLGIWGAGVAGLLLALSASLVGVARLERRTRRHPVPRVCAVAEEAAMELGLDSPPRVLEGPPGSMAISWGLLRAAVALPLEARQWEESRLRTVLLHELAHVRRRDSLTQVIAEVALALHWPNPLAWLAARRLRAEREHACDDLVLLAGARPSEYAGTLLALARSDPGPSRLAWGGSALGPGRRTALASRMRAILDPGRRRVRTAPGRAWNVGATATLVILLAAASPVSGPDHVAPALGEDRTGGIDEPTDATAAGIVGPATERPAVGISGPATEPSSADIPGRATAHADATRHPAEATDPEFLTSVSGVRGSEGPGDETDRATPPGTLAVDPASLRAARVPGATQRFGLLTTSFHPVNAGPAAPSVPAPDPGATPLSRIAGGAGGCGAKADASFDTQNFAHRPYDIVIWRGPACEVEVRITGEVRFSSDFRSVVSLAPGASVRIDANEHGVRQELEITPGPDGRPRYRYRLDRRDREHDDEVGRWSEGILLEAFRRGAFQYEERVVALLRDGGVARVLREFDILETKGIHLTRHRYSLALLDLTELTETEALGLVARAPEQSYGSSVLHAVLDRHSDSDRVVEAVILRALSLDGQSPERLLRVALARQASPSAATLRTILPVTRDAVVLTWVAESRPLVPELQASYVEAAAGLPAGRSKASALTALLHHQELANPALLQVLRTAREIAEGRYAAQVLVEVAERYRLEGAIREAYLEILESVEHQPSRATASDALLFGAAQRTAR